MPNRRRRGAHKRTIIDLQETTPATASRRREPGPSDDLSEDIDFDWRPRPLERAVEGNRSFRWPIIGAALVLAAIAILAVRGLGTFSDAQADERLTAYRTAVDDFSDALDALEASLPAVGVEEALAFENATESLRDVASEDLPGLPPFVPQGALGEVTEAQEHLLAMADVALSISADLEVSATYSDASQTLFAIPPLPFSAPEELIAAAAEAVAAMESETRATLAGLEPVEPFTDYVEEVEAALEELPDWTDRYILALRREEADAAATLVAEIETRAQNLRDELDVGLSSIAIGVEERIAELRAAVDEALVLTATR